MSSTIRKPATPGRGRRPQPQARPGPPSSSSQSSPTSPTSPSSSSSNNPDIFRLTADKGVSDDDANKVQTSSAPLSVKEEKALDELAKLFSIQEERCLSRVDYPGAPGREASRLSKDSLTPSQQMSEASFIYQHVNFQVLSTCVPGFVKKHLDKKGRYLPETFILRVNFWRRRRALGEDSISKRGGVKEPTVRMCGGDHSHGTPTPTTTTTTTTPTTATPRAALSRQATSLSMSSSSNNVASPRQQMSSMSSSSITVTA